MSGRGSWGGGGREEPIWLTSGVSAGAGGLRYAQRTTYVGRWRIGAVGGLLRGWWLPMGGELPLTALMRKHFVAGGRVPLFKEWLTCV
jgi:hypothetical protein